MRRIARIGIGLIALGCAAGAAAQSFNQSINRYRTAKAVCAEVYQARLARPCDADCRAKAAARQTKCLEAAETAYRAAIRRELRPRR